MRKWLCTFLLLCVLICCLGAMGQNDNVPTKEPLVLRYAENQPSDYPTTLAAKRFSSMVLEKTNGEIQIEVFCDGILGDEKDIIEQIEFGGVDMARVSLSPLAEYIPILNVLQLPYLYRDSKHQWTVLDGEIGNRLLASGTDIGIIGLAWYDAGARNFYTSEKPITCIQDIKGMTIRVQESQMMVDMIEALGASATQTGFADVYSCLLTGTIDGAENNWPSYEATGHYEVAKFYTLDEHNRVPEMQIISSIVWNKLTDEQRSIINECARASALYERELWEQREKTSRQKVVAEGIQVFTLSPEEKQKFQDAMSGLYQKYGKGNETLVDQIVSLE